MLSDSQIFVELIIALVVFLLAIRMGLELYRL